RVVAEPCADLVARGAGPPRPRREADGDDELAAGERRLVGAEEELPRLDLPVAAGRADLDRRVERDRSRRELGPGRAEGDRPADRAAPARLGVADVAGRLAKQRLVACDALVLQ